MVRGGGQVEVVVVPDPTPGPGQALVRSLACGVCGSDVHFAELVRAGALDDGVGVVLGHEFCVEVVDYGPATEPTVPIGGLACSVPYSAGPGGTELVGFSPAAPGAFADYLLLDADKLVDVPFGLAPEAAALCEPLAVGRHAAGLAGPTDRRTPAVVLGAGPVGLSVVLALRAAGRGPVLVSELAAVRRTAAERLGADIVVNPAERSPFALWDMLGVSDGVPSPLLAGGVGRAPPVTVFECTGTPGMLQQILDGVPIGSRIVVVGACVDADAIVPATGVVKELELVFSFAYRPGELVEVLHDIAGGALDVSPLVTGTVGLAGVAGALDALARDPSHIKIVVRPGL